jgi:lysophospholipid acyltransferase (LPLAT)-like uncharacterized protein
MRLRDRVLAWTVSWLGWFILHAVGKTSRLIFHVPPEVQELLREGTPFVYAFWHRFQLLLAYVHRNQDVSVLVSQSRDGELIARVLDRLGYRPVRGSSSRGGVRALLEMLECLRTGRRVAFTPDGPRGPFRSVQPGVVAAAQKSGYPVVAVAWAGTRAKVLNSWDRFLVPLPFGRFHVVYGPPVWIVPGDAEAEDKVRRALDEAQDRAEQILRAGPASGS